MKKVMLGVAIAYAAMLAMSPVASANFVQPVGTSATVTGSLHYAANIISATCALSFGGRVASSTTLSVTTGGGTCNVGGITPGGFPWTQTIDLVGNWSRRIRRTLAVPLIGNCVYEGTPGGTYVSDGEGITILTVEDSASSVMKTSGSSLCTSDPTVSGEFEVNVGIL